MFSVGDEPAYRSTFCNMNVTVKHNMKCLFKM